MGTDLFFYHGYCELYIDGKWIKATPAFDLEMCQENRIIPVEFDGENHAVLHSHNRDGDLHNEYVQDHGHYHDIPLDKLFKGWIRAYGPERVEKWDKIASRETTEC